MDKKMEPEMEAWIIVFCKVPEAAHDLRLGYASFAAFPLRKVNFVGPPPPI